MSVGQASLVRVLPHVLPGGVLFHPSQFENLLMSIVHVDIDDTLEEADDILDLLPRERR
jgi:glutamate-1-semialdehyde aminotransferase